jgi:hypothetical protein
MRGFQGLKPTLAIIHMSRVKARPTKRFGVPIVLISLLRIQRVRRRLCGPTRGGARRSPSA